MGKYNNKIMAEFNPPRKWVLGRDLSYTTEDLTSLKIDNVVYKVPKFIINNEIPDNYSNKTINLALSFTRNLLVNKFFLPNNLYFPKSRLAFENCFS